MKKIEVESEWQRQGRRWFEPKERNGGENKRGGMKVE